MSNTMREAFESWALNDSYLSKINAAFARECYPDAGYDHTAVNIAWRSWCAALTAPAPSAAEPVAPGWTSQEIIEAFAAAGLDDRTLRRLMSALKVVDKRTRAPALPRPDDDALWDKTLKERDDYHEWADQLAARISSITGVDIGEHSSANNPWQNAIDAADELAAPPAPQPTEAEPSDFDVLLQEFEDAVNEYRDTDPGDKLECVGAQTLMDHARIRLRSHVAALKAEASGRDLELQQARNEGWEAGREWQIAHAIQSKAEAPVAGPVAPLHASIDFLPHDDILRYACRVLEGDHPIAEDKAEARRGLMRLRASIRPAPSAAEDAKDAEPKIGAVLAYTVKAAPGVYGATIGADGSGDYAVVFLGSEEQGANAASQYVRALEQRGVRLANVMIMHGDCYSGPQITAIDAAMAKGGAQ